MDIISVAQFKKRLIDLLVRSRQESLPKKPQDRHILLNSVVLDMEVDREYTEREVNAVIQGWTMMVGCDMRVDVFSIRRELVDRGYLERDKWGASYRVCETSPGYRLFVPEVNDLDVVMVIEDGRAEIEARKQAFLKQKEQV
ncbi:MAG: DUF2087 domain-containing protein [Candidatus Latescibacteria bacterium]|nr:DUF2087 domain-containing protein [Candidatus Latescibacterota bacterium]